MQRHVRFVAPIALAALILAACQGGGNTSSNPASGGGNGKSVTIGVDLPLSGGEAPNGEPTLKAIQLAVKEANAAGGIGGYDIKVSVKDDAVNGVHNPDQGATNVTALVGDENVIGMVGPYNSNVGAAEIPITAPAGLLQCSPANTAPSLTKPDAEGKLLRGDNKVSYVRVAATDDLQGPALADYLYTTLGKKSVFIVDDTETYGAGLADTFEAKFKELGGTVTARQGVTNSDGSADYTSILTAAQGANPEAVMYGGVTSTGGAKLRTQMADVGMGDLPFVGGDGIVDGNGSTDGSYVNLAGEDAANSYGTVAAIHDIPDADAFSKKYNDEYGEDLGAYSASAYACTQIILKALTETASSASDMKDLREKVRAYVTDSANKFDTVLGQISFDENGDSSQKIISYYKVDTSAADGAGDWVFDSQKDFAGQ
ncbi:MAG TPA: branched-chain amino acid ABC transporter substrate-binding protein [Candidatus Limnocylindria bacterium]|nr:branched-chain amino acid ABC transporter substrate-binding protein [Candidatus Limnocylindria bacterium]